MDFKKMTVYQIYPKSFMDSNGDGFGDLHGIVSKLDYIAELGVDCIWLTPIYTSPQRDNGYDVADYCAIDPRYGNMEDFDELVAQCESRGIIIMLDMVFNHTSSEHEWFKQALEGNPKYRDYYIFRNGTKGGGAPTNWISKFGGSAWEQIGDEYYLHLFDVSQPDLNWENPSVREEIYKIMDFWLSKGIRGFRFDVINLISKPEVFENDDQGDGRRFYTDGRNVHQYLQELNARTFGKYDCVTVGEMSSTTIENCVKYSNPDRKELSMVFNFHHLKVDYKNGDKWTDSPFDFMKLKDLLHTWQVEMERQGGCQAVFWCNHDQPRAVSRFGDDGMYHAESAKMLATTIHLMRGTPYVYQGEEIGMTNAYFSGLNDYRDVESINYYNILSAKGIKEEEIFDILSKKSRDNARTPMQWDSSKHGGFTSGTPWIPTARNYTEINAKKALAGKNSVFRHYQELINIRKQRDIVAYGSYTPVFEEDMCVFAYLREYNNERLLVISNFYGTPHKLDISGCIEFFAKPYVLISNYDDLLRGGSTLTLRPYESLAICI